ncbi:MAG: hypothetical protein ABSB56_09080 [Nitrososphaerales archaeon]|jgi:hypothetical protein
MSQGESEDEGMSADCEVIHDTVEVTHLLSLRWWKNLTGRTVGSGPVSSCRPRMIGIPST